ncbi:hypothetical protein [Vitiosangium sp. GDMCC 1.1324]|uniref:hypothetical protein n=1 Tax=Vitiosangium sp. (strain GDMCC 1.1324) TaxID=2138576 RepID=UPI000D3A84DA|nr:hypothetical protein [Vitiosangium sp. GDMCC 1.1324]PTL80232.1 hypothetical protein DAT35_29990 [Vitiosangium sp. GDMCC 1.1324]
MAPIDRRIPPRPDEVAKPKPPPKPAPKIEKVETAKDKATTAIKESKNAQQTAKKDARALEKAEEKQQKAQSHYDRLNRDADNDPKFSPEQQKARRDAREEAKKQLDDATDDVKAAKTKAGDSRAKAMTAADKALAAQKTANQEATKSRQPVPFPLADAVVDTFDAGSLTAKQQTQLFGAPSQVTAVEAAKSDAGRIAAPGASVDLNKLKAQLQENHDPAYQKALIQDLKPQLTELAKGLTEDVWTNVGRKDSSQQQAAANTLGQLDQLTKELQPEAQRALADGFAAGFKDGARLLGQEGLEALKGAGKRGESGGFLGVLAGSLQSAGKTESAQYMARIVKDQIKSVREDFEKKAGKVEELNARLAHLVSGFGSGMSADQKKAAIAAFKERHKDEYAAVEAAAQNLHGLLKAAPEMNKVQVSGEDGKELQGEVKNLLKQAGAFAETEYGQKAIQDDLAQSLETDGDKPSSSSWFDSVAGELSKDKDLGDSALKFSGAATKAVGALMLNAMAEKGPEGATQILDGLKNHAALFGVSDEVMQEMTPLMEAVVRGDEGAVAKMNERYKALSGEINGGVGGTTTLTNGNRIFGGLMIATSAVGVVKAVKDGAAGDLELKDGIKAVGDTVGGGADTAAMVLEIMGRNPATLTKLLGGASGVGTALGAVSDGISSWQEFKNGHALTGGSKAAAAVGGAVLATTLISGAVGAQVVPVAGQVIGGLLFVGGTVAAVFSSANDKTKDAEKDAQAFLEAGGVPKNVAEKLKAFDEGVDAGGFFRQAAAELAIKPEQLLARLNGMNEDQLETFMKAAKETEHDKNGVFNDNKDTTPGQWKTTTIGGGKGGSVTKVRLEGMEDAVAWLRYQHLPV